MLSRIAESLYWIGRYVERAEDTARITDVNYHHIVGMGSSPDAEARRARHWEALIAIVGDEHRFHQAYGEATEESVPAYLTFDTTNPNSIISCIARARELARTMRHQIASEMWEGVNRFHLDLQRWHGHELNPVGMENAHLFYRSVIEFSHFFQGLTDSTMPREEGWHFLQAGKFLERAEKTARALDVKYHLLIADVAPHAPMSGAAFETAAEAIAEEVPGEWHQWQAVLRSLSAYEAYYKLYRSAVEPREVIEMLTFSPVFPRSIRFSIDQVVEALDRIATYRAFDLEARGHGGVGPVAALPLTGGEAERDAGRLRSKLAYGTVEEVFDAGLHAYLVEVQRACYRLGDRLQTQYFLPRALRLEEVVA